MIFGLFKIGNYEVTWVDLGVAVGCLAVLLIVLFIVIHDIKKQSRLKAERINGENASDSDVTVASRRFDAQNNSELNETSSAKGEDGAAAVSKKDKKQARKEAKLAAKSTKQPKPEKVEVEKNSSDPLYRLLGFDPYSAVDVETCEITEAFYDGEQETEDMRQLRERMHSASGIEKKLSVYRERLDKIKYEISKTSRFLRDNGIVITSATAAGEKLKSEFEALTSDKRKLKANKESIAAVRREIENNQRAVTVIKRNVVAKNEEEKLLKEAQTYLESEIARTEHELAFVNSDIKRLNDSVGAELEKIEKDNRARLLMSKYRELKPMLVAVNSSFRAIGKADEDLETIHEKKSVLRTKLDRTVNDLKTAYGAKETEFISQKIGELNKRMLALDAKEEEVIKLKEEMINEYKDSKRKANDFLDNEKYDLEDIIVAEDKVVGELEYEQVKADYEARKKESEARYEMAQKKYDSLISRKVKFKRNQEAERLAYETELQNAVKTLKQTRLACEKAANDAEKVLPTLSPLSLIKSGNGVISKERLAKRASIGVERDLVAADRVRNELDANSPVPQETAPDASAAPPAFPVAQTAAQIQRLLEKLNALERMALRQKEQRAMQRVRPNHDGNFDVSSSAKIEKRKAQIIAMRKNLKYIDSPRAAREFKQRLYQLSISLDEEEMSDNVLSEMIRRTMDEATRLGDKFGNN